MPSSVPRVNLKTDPGLKKIDKGKTDEEEKRERSYERENRV
jgi:hypothetical protein